MLLSLSLAELQSHTDYAFLRHNPRVLIIDTLLIIPDLHSELWVTYESLWNLDTIMIMCQ